MNVQPTDLVTFDRNQLYDSAEMQTLELLRQREPADSTHCRHAARPPGRPT
jgi:hypothetical protein